MTFAELVQEAKRLVDADPSAPELDSYFQGWVTRGLDDLTPVLRLEGKSSFQTTSGRAEYPLPADLYELRHVQWQGGPELDLLPLGDFHTSGYRTWGGNLELQPVPAEQQTIELAYYRKPRALTAPGDLPDLPDQSFAHLLVLYAAAMHDSYDQELERGQGAIWPLYAQGKKDLDHYTLKRTRQIPLGWKVER